MFVQKGGTRILVMSDLEVDRAKSQASVDRVLSWSKIAAPLEKGGRRAEPAEVIALALQQLGISRVEVPQGFPLGLAMELDARGIRLVLGPDPFWPEREIKQPREVRFVTAIPRNPSSAARCPRSGAEAVTVHPQREGEERFESPRGFDLLGRAVEVLGADHVLLVEVVLATILRRLQTGATAFADRYP